MKRAAKSESMTGSTCSLLSAALSGMMGGAEVVVRSGVSGKARRMMWSKRKMQRAKARRAGKQAHRPSSRRANRLARRQRHLPIRPGSLQIIGSIELVTGHSDYG